jgi:hypothetical protein
MADQVTTPDPPPVDPLQLLVTNHLARMQEIGNDGRTATQLGGVAVLGMISKNMGLRNAAYDKALALLSSPDTTV